MLCWSSSTSTPDPWKLRKQGCLIVRVNIWWSQKLKKVFISITKENCSPGEDHERELSAMTIFSKLCVPLTRINNNTPLTMLCTKRYRRIITEPLWVKKIPPGGHLYVKYREDSEIGYEYWLHNEDKGYAEGERVSFNEVYESADLVIEPSSSAGPLGFSLVQRIGPLFGRCLVFRLTNSCGMSCFDDPVATPAPTTLNAAVSGQASTAVVAPPEVQLMVNPGEDQRATPAPPAEVDPGATLEVDPSVALAPPTEVAVDSGATLTPPAAVDPGQASTTALAYEVPLVVDPGQALGTILAHALAMPSDPVKDPDQAPTPPQAIPASTVIPSEDHDPSPTPLHTP